MKELTEREAAIVAVLDKRIGCCRKSIKAHEEEIEAHRKQIAYLEAKMDGYEQAIDLLNQPLESITIEL